MLFLYIVRVIDSNFALARLTPPLCFYASAKFELVINSIKFLCAALHFTLFVYVYHGII